MSSIHTVTHTASGASIKIHPYGATLLSYSCGKKKEHLFVSECAVLDGSKPVRGGIPLVFPIFGPPADPESTMPQHGFARRNLWTLVSEHDNAASAGCVYQLLFPQDVKDGVGAHNPWAAQTYECCLRLAVDFDGQRLTTTLHVKNTSPTTAFPFQALLHTYYKVAGQAALRADQCYVTGLQGYTVTDKVDASQSGAVLGADTPVTIASEVDRVCTPPNNIDVVCVTIGTGDGEALHMNARAAVDGKPLPVSCVVWNPHKEKAAGMSDFGSEQYREMICVEPGILGDNVVVEPGKEGKLEQVVLV